MLVEFERLMGVSLSPSSPLVFSCLAGIRSEKAVGVARGAGYTNTSNYRGGWREWSEQQTF